MRTISQDHEALLTRPGRKTALRVRVRDASGTLRDLTSYAAGHNMVVNATWNEDVDSNGYVADVDLRRAHEKLSLNPLQTSSALNHGFNPAAAYAPLLDIGREILVEWALVPHGSSPSSWNIGFHGYIDTLNLESDPIKLSCRDKSARIIDRFAERERVYNYAQTTSGVVPDRGAFIWQRNTRYELNELVTPTNAKATNFVYKVTVAGTTGDNEPGDGGTSAWPTTLTNTIASGTVTFRCEFNASTTAGTALETSLAQILLDNMGTDAPPIYTPLSPAWMIRWWGQQRAPSFEIIRTLAEQIGWDIRYKWDNSTSQFRLTLWAPERDKTIVDRAFGKYDGPRFDGVKKLAIDIADIRNVVRVIYSDYNDKDPQGYARRKVVELTDSDSVLAYGRRFAELAESSNSNIDTSTEANALAEAVLSDLSRPTADHAVELPFFPFAELGDLYQFPADDRNYSAAQKFAVVSIQHSVNSNGKATTTLNTRGKVSGGYRKWLEKETRALGPFESHALTDITAPALTITATPIIGGHRLRTAIDNVTRRPNMRFEHHLGDSSSFTPSASTLQSVTESREVVIPDQVPGKTQYHKVTPLWFNAGRIVRGEPSAPLAVTAGRGNAGHLYDRVNWGNLPLNGGFETVTEAGAVPDHWAVDSANGTVWGTHAVLLQDGSGTSGQSYVKLVTNNTTTVARIYTAKFVVNERMQSLAEVWAKMVAGSGNNFSVELLLTDKDDSFVATYTDSFSLAADVGVWKPYRLVPRAPVANAAFGRMALTVELGASGREVHIDSARFWQEEPWHEIGGSGEPAFANSWVNYNSGTHQTAAFRMDQRGRVHIKGFIKDGTVNATAFTLPVGYRPPREVVLATISNGAIGYWVIETGGGVKPVTGSNVYFSIEGSFDPW